MGHELNVFLEPAPAEEPHLTHPTTVSEMSQVEARVSHHVRVTPVHSLTARFRTLESTGCLSLLETTRVHINTIHHGSWQH
jgi:hypothetical protein